MFPFYHQQQQASRICYSVCSGLINPTSGFSLSNDGTASKSQAIAANMCANDFITIVGGFQQDTPANVLDRYCDTALNPADGKTNVVVCSKF